MIEEPAFVPFTASEIPGGPWLVFAPHADDETFGMGGSILKAKAQGIEVHLVVLTDGALGGVRDDLVAIRQKEVESAVSYLGIASLDSWRQPDRGLQLSDELVTRAAVKMTSIPAKAVFFPGLYEPHPDHRMTARLVWAALQQLGTSLAAEQLPSAFAYEIGVQSPINTLVDITPVMEAKQTAIDLYNSQNTENDYPDLVTSLNRARTFSLPNPIKYAEGFFKYPTSAFVDSLKANNDLYYDQYWQ